MIKNLFIYALILSKYPHTVVRHEKHYTAYYKAGVLHREDGPAVIVTKKSNPPSRGISMTSHSYYERPRFRKIRQPNKHWAAFKLFIKTNLQRLDVSISTWYFNEEWWLNGKELTEEQVNAIIEKQQIEKNMTFEPPVKAKIKNKI